MLNKISIAFWLADKNGKIIIANSETEKFSSISTITGNEEKNAFQNSVVKQIAVLNELLEKTKTIAVTENFVFEEKDSIHYKIIKIPIISSNNEVVASCGLIQPNEAISIYDSEFNYILKAFEELPIAAALFNYQGMLAKYSKNFAKIFEETPLEIGLRINEVFPNDFSSQINEFLLDPEQEEFSSRIKIFKDVENDVQVKVKKIFNSQNVFIATLIIFEEEKNKNLSKISVLNMIDKILDTSPYPLFIYDEENLKFLSVNKAAIKFYGYPLDKFLQMDLTDLYLPEDIQSLIDYTELDDTVFEKPVRHKLSDGSIVVVQLKRKELEFEGRKAILTFVKDITKLAEINKAQRELNTILSFANELVIETDADGFISKVNSSAEKHLGYSLSELENKTFISLLSEKERSKINKKIFLNHTTENIEAQISLKTKTGKVLNSEMLSIPLFDVFEELTGYSIIIKIQNQLERKTNVEIPTNENKSSSSIDVSFLSHLFHEILTPINVIIGFTQELLESLENPTPEQKESAQIISENQQALMQLIDAATEYAAIEQNQIRIKPEEFGFVEILDKIEENVKKIAKASNVELKYGKISSSIVLNNDKHLTIMFLSQLWEFAIRGTKEEQVYLSAQPDNDRVLIYVKDLKSGISDNLLKAMNEYLTEDEAIVRRNYNVSRFAVRLFRKLSDLLGVDFSEVEKHGSIVGFGAKFPKSIETIVATNKKATKPEVNSIKAENKPNIGINAEERVAAKNISNQQVPVQNKSRVSTTPIVKQEKEVKLNDLRCLLLEDQVDSQLLFKQQMKELKEIEVFARFEDALPILRTKKFDFIVMDINLMGDYNGLEALREIRNLPSYKNVPVIASTAYMMPGDQERYLDAGFDAFVPKPILKDKLVKTLKEIL